MSPTSKNPYIINNSNNTDNSDVLPLHINHKKLWLEESAKIIADYYLSLPASLLSRLYRGYLWPRPHYWNGLMPSLSVIDNTEVLDAIMLSLITYVRQHMPKIVPNAKQDQCSEKIKDYYSSRGWSMDENNSIKPNIKAQDLFIIMSIILEAKDMNYSQDDFNYDLEKQKNMIKIILSEYNSNIFRDSKA